MPSPGPGRKATDEATWVAAVRPRFTTTEEGNGQHAAPLPVDRVVYVQPAPIHEAYARYWLLVLVLVVVGAAAGVVQAMSKEPTYSASARLGVGLTNVSNPAALGGFASSGPALAAAYGRAAAAQPVVESVARKLHTTPEVVRGTIVASSVPETPVIRVDAVAKSENEAMAMANAMSAALVDYAGNTDELTRESERLLRRYRAAQRELETMRAKVDRAEERAGDGGSDEAKSELRSAKADASAASLRVRALGASYETSQQGLSGGNPVRLLEPAASATSDEQSVRLRRGFLGGAVGLIVGSAIALLLANRRLKRTRP